MRRRPRAEHRRRGRPWRCRTEPRHTAQRAPGRRRRGPERAVTPEAWASRQRRRLRGVRREPRRRERRRHRGASVRPVRRAAPERAPCAAFHRPPAALRHELAALGARAQLCARPFPAQAEAHAGGLGGDEARGVVCAGDDLDRASRDADRVAHAHEDAAEDTDDADEELQEGSRALVQRDAERVEVEFEEDAGGAAVVLDLTRVVCDGVLMRVERGTAGCNVGCWDDVKEVLVGDEI